MKEDEFEQLIGKQTFREVPSEWRKQLLEQAIRGAAPRGGGETHPSVAVGLLGQLRSLLWPCPQAWAGLAAIWIGLLMVNVGMNRGLAPAAAPEPAAPAWAKSFKDQEKLLVELIGEADIHNQNSSKSSVQLSPRSARREEFFRV